MLLHICTSLYGREGERKMLLPPQFCKQTADNKSKQTAAEKAFFSLDTYVHPKLPITHAHIVFVCISYPYLKGLIYIATRRPRSYILLNTFDATDKNKIYKGNEKNDKLIIFSYVI